MKNFTFISSLLILVFSFSVNSFAEGGKLSLIAESKYFSLYSQKDLDVYSLLEKLNFDYFLQPNTLLEKENKESNGILTKVLDALYLEVSDILDIHIYSYHGNIKIVTDHNAIKNILSKKLSVSNFDEKAIYIHEENTIYISSSDLTLGMLSHEIAHAIISHYFVVPPPAKAQEILCGYVEYTLRKSAGLPLK